MILEVQQLSLATKNAPRGQTILQGINLAVKEGEWFGLVGLSGAGKSLTALAIMGLLPANIEIVAGDISYAGRNISGPAQPAAFRGQEIAIVFQDPKKSLNPILSIGRQLRDIVVAKKSTHGLKKAASEELILSWLKRVGIDEAQARLGDLPGQFSGGERQRIALVMALINRPKVLICDEATSSLDPLAKLEFVRLMAALKDEYNLTILMISHEMELLKKYADRIMVIDYGSICETLNPPFDLNPDSTPATRRLMGQETSRR